MLSRGKNSLSQGCGAALPTASSAPGSLTCELMGRRTSPFQVLAKFSLAHSLSSLKSSVSLFLCLIDTWDTLEADCMRTQHTGVGGHSVCLRNKEVSPRRGVLIPSDLKDVNKLSSKGRCCRSEDSDNEGQEHLGAAARFRTHAGMFA